MIDMHFHLLPAVDDGSSSLDESIEMARAAFAEGTRAIVCTSHINAETDGVERLAVFDTARAALAEALEREGIELELIPGAEWMLTPDLIDVVRKTGRIGTTRSFLYELSQFMTLDAALFMAEDATDAGLVPVLAHPERYHTVIQGKASDLDEVVEAGAYLQLTNASLAGDFGPAVRRTAESIALRFSQRILIASDAHDSRIRAPKMRAGVAALNALAPGLGARVLERIEWLTRSA